MTIGADDWIDHVPTLSLEQVEHRLAALIRILRMEQPHAAGALVTAIRPLWERRVSWERVLELASLEVTP